LKETTQQIQGMETKTQQEINIKDLCINNLTKLLNKYKHNPNVIEKIYDFVVFKLPLLVLIESPTREPLLCFEEEATNLTITKRKTNNELDENHKNDNDVENETININNDIVLEKSNITKEILTREQELFTKLFLTTNKIYYLKNTKTFYIYDKRNFAIIKEDEVHYKILTSITYSSENPTKIIKLFKQKTKEYVINYIKENRALFDCIPETYTIQSIVGFLSKFFKNKSQIKYFLTIIGDNILKKNVNDIFFIVGKKTKELINDILDISNILIGKNGRISNFYTKYQDMKPTDKCRILNIEYYDYDEFYKKEIKNIGLNLLCVACYYSNRFENSENFIHTKSDNMVKSYTLLLKENPVENIIGDFLTSYFETTTEDTRITIKDIIFIWKIYTQTKNLPNIINNVRLKDIVVEKLNYKNETREFHNITSKYLPNINMFLTFWNENIKIIIENNEEIKIDADTDTNTIKTGNDEVFETDEIFLLYKNWYKKNMSMTPPNTELNTTITEKDINKIIKHYFKNDNVAVYDDKYITNIRCKLWDKKRDIAIFMEIYKERYKRQKQIHHQHQTQEYTHQEFLITQEEKIIPFEEIYNDYTKYYKVLDKLIVSKTYFEEYLKTTYENHIVFENFILIDWIYNI